LAGLTRRKGNPWGGGEEEGPGPLILSRRPAYQGKKTCKSSRLGMKYQQRGGSDERMGGKKARWLLLTEKEKNKQHRRFTDFSRGCEGENEVHHGGGGRDVERTGDGGSTGLERGTGPGRRKVQQTLIGMGGGARLPAGKSGRRRTGQRRTKELIRQGPL